MRPLRSNRLSAGERTWGFSRTPSSAGTKLSCTLSGFPMCAKPSGVYAKESSKAGTMSRWTIFGGASPGAVNILLDDYAPLANKWFLWDNSTPPAKLLAESASQSIIQLQLFFAFHEEKSA